MQLSSALEHETKIVALWTRQQLDYIRTQANLLHWHGFETGLRKAGTSNRFYRNLYCSSLLLGAIPFVRTTIFSFISICCSCSGVYVCKYVRTPKRTRRYVPCRQSTCSGRPACGDNIWLEQMGTAALGTAGARTNDKNTELMR